MADAQRMQLQLHRTQIDVVPVDDLEQTRAWVLGHVLARSVLTGGHVQGMLLFLHSGVIEQAELPAIELGQEAVWARAFLELRSRPGVRHGFRVGEVLLRSEGGARRAAAVVSFEPVPGRNGDVEVGRWWRAFHLIGQGGDRFGATFGGWEIAEGEGLDTVDEVVREWIDPENIGIGGLHFDAGAPTPSRPIEVGVRRLESALPEDPMACLPLVLRAIGDDMLHGRPTPVVVLAARGAELFTYALRGDPPVPLEDLIRSVADRHDAELAGLVLPTVLAIDGGHRPGAALAIERNGARVQAVGRRLPPDAAVQEAEFHVVPASRFGHRPWVGQGPIAGLQWEPILGPTFGET